MAKYFFWIREDGFVVKIKGDAFGPMFSPLRTKKYLAQGMKVLHVTLTTAHLSRENNLQAKPFDNLKIPFIT